jgi:hydrogenase-4 component F
MIVLLLAVPLTAAGLLALAAGRAATVVHALAAVATLVVGLTVAVGPMRGVIAVALDGVLRADALSGWMIAVIVVVAALAAAEAPRYTREGSPRIFYPLFHLMVFTMLLAVSTDDVGVMWVAVEGTTLASVFLVNFDRTRASLEAAYKYLLICSVGIAIAFVGTVLVYYAEAVRQHGLAEHAPLRWTALLALAPALSPRVLQLAFVFVVVGYGTKAGLAPMHTWLPDAHSEAPAPVSALMSGVLLSVGAYAILRFKPIVDAAGAPGFARRILIALGLLSLAVAAAFLWNPGNYKRMLAYSSVEHIGLVALGLGFGGVLGVSGALLHVANHGLAKSVVFLLAGRIRAAYGTVELAGVRGLLRALPVTGRGFLLGVLALMGLPPFGLFTSEVMIFAAGFREGHAWAAAVGLVLTVVAFGGLLRAAHGMLFGPTPGVGHAPAGWIAAVPMAAALVVLVLTGLAWPPGLAAALELAARVVVP